MLPRTIVGYLLAGTLVGPYTPGFVADAHIAEQFAEVPPEITKMITCTNAGKFYGLIN